MLAQVSKPHGGESVAMNKSSQYCAFCGKRLEAYEGIAPDNALMAFRIQYQDGQLQDSTPPLPATSPHPLDAYLPYVSMICAAAYRLTGDKETAERVVCETFATVLRHAACESIPASPKRHLLSTLRSTFLEHGFSPA